MEADFLKTLKQETKKNNSEDNLPDAKTEELSSSIELEGHEKGVFIKLNSSEDNSLTESNKRKTRSTAKSKKRFSNVADNTGIILHGNKMMQDFANKFSERLKFLKPIK
jgi:hypothetical protein